MSTSSNYSTSTQYFWNRAVGPEGPMPLLYKFYPIRVSSNLQYNSNLFDTLSESYLWHSNPLDFNDPFDCYSELVDYSHPTKESLTKWLDGKLVGTREAKRKEVMRHVKNPKPLRDALKANIPQQGVCSFTRNQISNTLWSHYADKHAGLCLIFDHKQLIDSGYYTSKVTYESEFKSLDHFKHPDEALFNRYTTKSVEWSYECEYRSLSDIVGKIKFPKTSLLGITFGCKTNDDDIRHVQKWVNEAGYSNLKCYRATMQTNSFDLLIKAL